MKGKIASLIFVLLISSALLMGCGNTKVLQEMAGAEETVSAETGAEDTVSSAAKVYESEAEADRKPVTDVESSKQSATEDKTQAVETVISNFEKLAQIPRPSGHEKEVSDYLITWSQNIGLNAKQDTVNNVIVDIPAVSGCESKPLTVLQCHMDMVAVAEEGYAFDPENDPIKVIRTERTLQAEHTSLGGDDGIGIAIAQYIAENNENHGPLRLIITTDEESGSTGVGNLDPNTLADAEYLINIDWEAADEVAVASASFIRGEFSGHPEWVEPLYDNPVELRVAGGLGGHSGSQINAGRANANIVMADLLTAFNKAGIRYCLASIEGGTAANVITPYAKAVITVHGDDAQRVTEEITRYNELLQAKYKVSDPDIHVEELYPNLLVQKVLSEEDRDSLLTLLTNLLSGVYTMSSKVENFVESSSNVGIVTVTEDGCLIVSATRSSEDYPEERIVNAEGMLAGALGFDSEFRNVVSAWAYEPDNQLIKIAKEVYLEQNGEEINEIISHTGLECGNLKQYNSDIQIISVGPTIENEHTPKETVDIPSIKVTINLIEGILAKIAE